MRWSTNSRPAGVPMIRSQVLRSRSTSSSWNARHGLSPEECVSRWRSVTPSLPRSPKAGRCFATGSSRATLPSCTRSRTAVAVASGLVSDARSKSVSRAIGTRSGRDAASPRTETCSSSSPSRGMRASTTAPAVSATLDRLVEGPVDARELALDHRSLHAPRTTPGSSTRTTPRRPSIAARAPKGHARFGLPCPNGRSDDQRQAQRPDHGSDHRLRRGMRIARVVAAHQLPHPDACDAAQLAGREQLLEQPVDAIGALADLLEQEDRAARVHLPGRPEARHERHEIAPDEAPLRPPAPARAAPQHGRPRLAGQEPDEGLDRRGRLVGALLEHRTVDAREPGVSTLPEEERGDVAVADERLARGAEAARVEQPDDAMAAVAAARAQDRVDLGIRDEVGELLRAPSVVAGEETVDVEQVVPAERAEAGRAPERLAGFERGALDRERRRGQPEGPARPQRARLEQGGHAQNGSSSKDEPLRPPKPARSAGAPPASGDAAASSRRESESNRA